MGAPLLALILALLLAGAQEAAVSCGSPSLIVPLAKSMKLTRRNRIPGIVKQPGPIKNAGVSDAVFLNSRDGMNQDRTFQEGWVRPGPEERNWMNLNNMSSLGIVQTSSNEFSMYISEHFSWPDNRLRRPTVRRHGFGAMHADHAGGEFTTRPLKLTGKTLLLNYATSAARSVQVEIQDEHGKPLPGYSLAESDLLFGDELDADVKWKSGNDLSGMIGKPVRLRFVLKEADLFALKFQ